ncbi:putative RNA-binding protein (contains KH domain) [Terriglobus roseus DSM 18391]|uniref:RNA-binding protein KhpA n=2 Tax=Terriglobus roseus TaxID=392734 RepID=I3ZHI4_TERRK|nr:putative RNA-binding protein (contains KH domain) [Terriglobus roseus DSM 18391]AFL88702.1 putative RNA-binding protein (contains KH domain) [Terriglobus roseus DSM 18391]
MTDNPLPGSVQQMCDLMTGMATALVDQPDKVRVEAETFETETVLRLYVATDDLGKLIGKQGRTARSLRTILGAAGSKLQQRFSLDVQSE